MIETAFLELQSSTIFGSLFAVKTLQGKPLAFGRYSTCKK